MEDAGQMTGACAHRAHAGKDADTRLSHDTG